MNIYGVGNDIIEIERIKKAICKNEKFLQRILTENEINYVKQNKNYYPSCAGRFAAKEAFYKSLGIGIREYGFKDIEVKNDLKGKPEIKILNQNLKKYCNEMQLKFFLSISHSKYNAIATLIATRDV